MTDSPSGPNPTPSPCDFRQIGLLSVEQQNAIDRLLQDYGRKLSATLSNQLRTTVDAGPSDIEQLSYSDLLGRLSDPAYLISVNVAPSGVTAVVELSLELAFPMIDLALGGPGTGSVEARDVTTIEEQILENLMNTVLHDLQTVWQTKAPLELTLERRVALADANRLMPPVEKLVALNFFIKLGDSQGSMRVGMPAAVVDALLRKLSEPIVYRRRGDVSNVRPQLQQRLLGARFETELVSPPSSVRIRQLMNLREGQVLTLSQQADQPVWLNIAGRQLFYAQAIRHLGARAALVKTALAAAPEGDKA